MNVQHLGILHNYIDYIFKVTMTTFVRRIKAFYVVFTILIRDLSGDFRLFPVRKSVLNFPAKIV